MYMYRAIFILLLTYLSTPPFSNSVSELAASGFTDPFHSNISSKVTDLENKMVTTQEDLEEAARQWEEQLDTQSHRSTNIESNISDIQALLKP